MAHGSRTILLAAFLATCLALNMDSSAYNCTKRWLKNFRWQVCNAQKKDSSLILTSLPPELLLEILKELDWRDVLRIRQTCKKLDNSSHTKSIWKHLLDEYSKNLSIPWCGLEKPVELCSTQELERLYLRWRRMDVLLCQDTIFPVQSLETEFPFRIQYIHILHGGRWAVIRDESATYMSDLYSTDVAPTLLIPSPIQSLKVEGLCHSMIAVDEIRDAPLLSFRVAIWTCLAEPQEGCAPRIDVYQVTATLTSQGDISGFSSHSLSTIYPGWAPFGVRSLDLQGSLVARVLQRGNRLDYVEIFNWEKANQKIEPCPRRNVICDRPSGSLSARLLPSSQIMLSCSGRVCILDILSFPETNNIIDPTLAPIPTTHLWNLDLEDEDDVPISRIFGTDEQYALVFWAYSQIHCMFRSSKSPSLVNTKSFSLQELEELYDIDLGNQSYCSLNIGVARSVVHGTLVLIPYLWPHIESDIQLKLVRSDLSIPAYNRLCFNALSGMLVHSYGTSLHIDRFVV